MIAINTLQNLFFTLILQLMFVPYVQNTCCIAGINHYNMSKRKHIICLLDCFYGLWMETFSFNNSLQSMCKFVNFDKLGEKYIYKTTERKQYKV